MRFAIHKKTVDPKNIPFDKVHTTIYQGVGLGEEWRVDATENPEELKQASAGFRKVTKKFDTLPEKQESKSILFILRRLFGLS